MYNTLDDIKRLLRTIEGKVKITVVGPPDDGNMSEADAQAFIDEIEGFINGKISIYYEVPVIAAPALAVLKHICGRLTAYAIYSSIYQSNIPNEAPDTITIWKNEAKEELEDLLTNASKDIHITGLVTRAVNNVPVRYNIPEKIFKERGVEGISTAVRSQVIGILRDIDIQENI